MTSTTHAMDTDSQLAAVRLVAQSNQSGTYLNGAINNGVGATFRYATGALTIDSVAVVLGDYVLFAGQTSGFQNGIYECTQEGETGVAAILTRRGDMQCIEQIKLGGFVPVYAGTTYGGSLWQIVEPLPAGIGTSVVAQENDINFATVTAAGSSLYLQVANNLSDLNSAATARTNLGVGSGSHVALASLTLPNDGLHLLDTNATHDLIISPGSNLTADRVFTITTGDAARTLTMTGDATLNQDVSSAGSPAFVSPTVSGAITVPNSGLHILDTDASHDLIITPGSDLSADRVLTITTGDAARTLTMTGDATLNQDVSSAGSPTFADPIVSTTITIPNSGLHVLDTNASHDLVITPGSDLTADRILTITTGDAARTLDISAASVTVSTFGASLVDDSSKLVALDTLGVKRATTAAYGGGAASNAYTATGLVSTDIVVATILASSNAVSILKAVPTADVLTVTFSADPGAATTVSWIAIATV